MSGDFDWSGKKSAREETLEERVTQLEALHWRLTADEHEELRWLASRWAPESKVEATAEMAMRMAQLVCKLKGEPRSRCHCMSWGRGERAAIDRAER
jgi:hypothetical protein